MYVHLYHLNDTADSVLVSNTPADVTAIFVEIRIYISKKTSSSLGGKKCSVSCEFTYSTFYFSLDARGIGIYAV